jgi:hypothetical protein
MDVRDIVGRCQPSLEEAFLAVDGAARRMGFRINKKNRI